VSNFTAIFSQYFPAMLAIVGTIAIGVGGISKYREKRLADMLEATTTWKSLAESRAAVIADLKEKIAKLERQNQDYRDQANLYWAELQRYKPSSSSAPQGPPHYFEDE
jgi:uncharacterized coiled-coil protein SlyX